MVETKVDQVTEALQKSHINGSDKLAADVTEKKGTLSESLQN
jgi:hypothetical protein